MLFSLGHTAKSTPNETSGMGSTPCDNTHYAMQRQSFCFPGFAYYTHTMCWFLNKSPKDCWIEQITPRCFKKKGHNHSYFCLSWRNIALSELASNRYLIAVSIFLKFCFRPFGYALQ